MASTGGSTGGVEARTTGGEALDAAVDADRSPTFDPDVYDGTLGDDTQSGRKGGGILVPALLGAAVLVLLIGAVGIALSVGVGTWFVTQPIPDALVGIDGSSGAAGRGPSPDSTPPEPRPLRIGVQDGGEQVEAGGVEVGGTEPVEVVETPIVREVRDDVPQPGAREAIPDPPDPRPVVASTGVVRISSVPLTVELSVDGIDKGRTPKKLDLKPGAHMVQVRSDGRSAEFPIYVKAGEDARWCYSFPDKASNRGKCQ